jgi:hypothetical protein
MIVSPLVPETPAEVPELLAFDRPFDPDMTHGVMI